MGKDDQALAAHPPFFCSDDRTASTSSVSAPPDLTSPDGSEQQRKLPSCTACKRSKVRCDRKIPCSRCCRLRLECVPQRNLPGRPITLNRPLVSPVLLLQQQRPALELGSSLDRGWQPPPGAVLPPAPPIAPRQEAVQQRQAQPLVPYNCSLLIMCCASLLGTDRVVLPRAQAILLSWHIQNVLDGVDTTRGALSAVSTLFGIELPSQLPPPPPTPPHPLLQPAPHASAASFQSSEEGQLKHFLQACGDLDGSAVCRVASRRGRVEVTANERFSAQYMTATTLQDQMKAAALRPELIWGMSCVAPDSRRDFMASMCDACFTTADQARTVETACMLKVRDRYHLESVCLVRLRIYVSPCGWYSASVLLLLPIPVTRPLLATVSCY